MPRAPNFRHRSPSGGSYAEMIPVNNSAEGNVTVPALKATSNVMNMTLHLKDSSGKSFLHSIDTSNIAIVDALLDRAEQLEFLWKRTTLKVPEEKQMSNFDKVKWLQEFLVQPDEENGYSPLHWAVWNKNIVAILLLLRHALNAGKLQSSFRFTHRPALVLEGDPTSNGLTQKMVQNVDNEGFTPLQLLHCMQRHELDGCRKSLPQTSVVPPVTTNGRSRQPSFDDDDDDEFVSLRRDMRSLANLTDDSNRNAGNRNNARSSDTYDLPRYACEVLTFGPAHHCAVGVPQGGGSGQSKSSSTTHFRPQRVQTFGLDTVGREGSAVAIAASSHHTLVVTRDGHLFSFGLGTGGRLGTGDERHRPLPTRVLGALTKRNVVAIAAAENHSLCVTSEGYVFVWGSDRFGQLGVSSSDDKDSTTRCLPRRVDDLKHVTCVAVAAGERHSVALSKRGEVFVWGDNSSGQLGLPRQNGSQRVQRVDALWQAKPSKIATAVSASGMSTLVLITPTANTFPSVNTVYSWGHGNHMPIKIKFGTTRGGNQRSYHVNPTSIACAKYHNAAITADGRVYTWGLHSEPLGTETSKKSGVQSIALASPQVVSGMLPENGGGFAVAVSASEHHTAVLTDTGCLYTWGASHGKEVLGHEGVRWQPMPKRVPGVHRAVAVASAKEHTVLLIGASFPDIPIPSSSSSLEYMCAATVARHLDLFNVIPVLIMSERTQNFFLIEYCQEFIRRNLDGVLNLGSKSHMNNYLDEQLADGLHTLLHQERDCIHHPFIFDVVTAGNRNRPSFREKTTCSAADWAQACQILEKRLPTSSQVRLRVNCFIYRRLGRSRATSFHEEREASKNRLGGDRVLETGFQGCSDRCLMLIGAMDLSSKEAVKTKYDCLTKEIRGVRKRLNQIVKMLQPDQASEPMLTSEQRDKVSRRPLLQADLNVLERALERVTQRMREYNLLCNPIENGIGEPNLNDDRKSSDENEGATKAESPYRCTTCIVECPDSNSYALHLNGRKHRNRVVQATEEEKRQKAAALIAEKHGGAEQLEVPVASEVRRSSASSSLIAPAYTLPPPPHPIREIVENSSQTIVSKPLTWSSQSVGYCATDKPKGLREILEEESRKVGMGSSNGGRQMQSKPHSPALVKKPSPSSATGIGTPTSAAKLTVSGGVLKSPPWATAAGTETTLKPSVVGPAPSPTLPSPSTRRGISPLHENVALKPPPGSVTILNSPPAAAAAVRSSQCHPTPSPLGISVKPNENSGKRGVVFLGDFMANSHGIKSQSLASTLIPPTSATAAAAVLMSDQPKTNPAATWSRNRPVSTDMETPRQPIMSLVDIQLEEEVYSKSQGKSQIINKWFVERREKAASLAEIQEEDNRDREFRLLVEEQKRIEEQIERDREEQTKRRTRPKRRHPKSPKPNTNGKGRIKNQGQHQNQDRSERPSSRQQNNELTESTSYCDV